MDKTNDIAEIKKEINRIENAIIQTKSPCLIRDYEKYLRKLYKRLNEVKERENEI